VWEYYTNASKLQNLNRQEKAMTNWQVKQPEPVPPAIEWHRTKPSRLSLPSASLSIMSIISSSTPFPWPVTNKENRNQSVDDNKNLIAKL
jgi:hypothetical protein